MQSQTERLQSLPDGRDGVLLHDELTSAERSERLELTRAIGANLLFDDDID